MKNKNLYKNVSEKDLMIPGIGVIGAGETFDMPEGFHNANFEKVEKTEKPNKEDKN